MATAAPRSPPALAPARRRDHNVPMELAGAAGGVVWSADGRTLALVHRPRHADWSLPKGKLDPGESWHRAALREVAEETGWRARVVDFAGAKLRLERATPKLVLYWHMQAIAEGVPPQEEEIDEVRWLAPREALGRLDHESDRRLLRRTLAERRAAGKAPRARRPAPLERLLVVDRPCADEELAPWLRRIEDAVRCERGGLARAAG